MSEVGQGLILSGIGIVITFSALGILILIILAVKTLFPAGPLAEEAAEPRGEAEDQKRKAAAAAVAALLARRPSRQKGGLGQLLEGPPGPWWRLGLDRVHRKE